MLKNNLLYTEKRNLFFLSFLFALTGFMFLFQTLEASPKKNNGGEVRENNLLSSANSKWTAKWIWQSPGSSLPNKWLCFRKKVTLLEKPSSAPTRIAVENKYWLFINERLVVADGGMDIRPDFSNTYYDSLDIAPYLNSGENIISVLVWYKGGVNGYSQNMTKTGGLLFQSDLKGTEPSVIISDDSWKIKEHPAFIRTPQQQQWGDYKWVEYPVIYDAQKDFIGVNSWTSLSFDEHDWPFASIVADASGSPWNRLIYRTIPMHETHKPIDFINKAVLPKRVTSDTTFTLELGNNIQGHILFKVNSKTEGDTILIRMNEWYTERYITKTGIQEYTTFQWQNPSGQPWKKHSVEFSFKNVKGEIQVLDVKFLPDGYNTKILGKFESDNARLNTLWKKCVNTSYVCMRDQFYDCPDRERGQWWGDVSEQILYSFYLYDHNASLLAKKGFRELFNTQKEDKSLYTTAPGNRFHLPDQNMAAVMSIGDYFMYTADSSLVQELYPKISAYFKQYISNTRNSDGMLILQKDVWNWIDWGDSLDVKTGSANTVVNGLFVRLSETMKMLAKVSGALSDIKYYENMQRQVKKNFNSYFWNNKKNAYAFYRLKDSLSSISDDRSNAWAVLAGAVDNKKLKGVIDLLKSKLWASPYQERYIEEALFVLGFPEEALLRMLSYYQPDIDSWSQTMWERMGNNSTNNHAWAASPCYLLGAYVAGIKPIKPGYSEYEVMPMLGNLTYVSASVPTQKDVIAVSDSLREDKFTMDLVSPKGCRAIVGIPKIKKWNSVEVNGTTIWKKGKFIKALDAISSAKSDKGFIKFKVAPGRWKFTARLK
ncbi:MAG: amylo-alpha-1,6-glucosidase [Clostridiales bacterium]